MAARRKTLARKKAPRSVAVVQASYALSRDSSSEFRISSGKAGKQAGGGAKSAHTLTGSSS